MWTVIFVGLAALIWLIELVSGPDGQSAMGVSARGFDKVALGFATLATAQLTITALHHWILRGGSVGRTVRTELLQTLLRATVYLGAFFVYGRWVLGLDITGLLATSAVLSLILGLALQATLGNVFAGLSIELERALRAGDYLRRGALSGEVVSLSWRSVHVRSDTGAILVVPNSALTSDLVEVIPRGRLYSQEVEFSVSTQRPPGLVIQKATHMLRNGVPGVCQAGSSEVLLRESQPDAAAYRYVARFFITDMPRRQTIASAVLERIWYELSRIGDVRTLHAPIAGELAAEDGDSPLDTPLATVAPALRQQLRKAANVRRFGRGEWYRQEGLGLIVEGCMEQLTRPSDAGNAIQELAAQVARAQRSVPGSRRLDYVCHQTLSALGRGYMGPISEELCDRIASSTDDPWLAYRTFATFIPDTEQRQEFLRQAPGDSLCLRDAGSWLWVESHALRPNDSYRYRAHENCTILVWNRDDLRYIIHNAAAPEVDQLTSLLDAGGLSVPELSRLTEA